MKHCSPLNINTLSLIRLTLQAFISLIPSQMHASPIALWCVILSFMLLVLSTANKVLLANLLHKEYDLSIKNVWFSDIQDAPHFDSLILSNAFLCNFLPIFCFDKKFDLSRSATSKNHEQINIILLSSQFTEYVQHQPFYQIQQQIYKFLYFKLKTEVIIN